MLRLRSRGRPAPISAESSAVKVRRSPFDERSDIPFLNPFRGVVTFRGMTPVSLIRSRAESSSDASMLPSTMAPLLVSPCMNIRQSILPCYPENFVESGYAHADLLDPVLEKRLHTRLSRLCPDLSLVGTFNVNRLKSSSTTRSSKSPERPKNPCVRKPRSLLPARSAHRCPCRGHEFLHLVGCAHLAPAIGADHSHEALREDARTVDDSRKLSTPISRRRVIALGVIRVEGGEHEVPRQCRLDGYLGCFQVADLADHDNVGSCLTMWRSVLLKSSPIGVSPGSG